MNFIYRSLFLCGLISFTGLISIFSKPQSANAELKIKGNQMIAVPLIKTASATTITGYPLTNFTTIALPYGWQIHPITGKVFFHSGVDLVAPVGTQVKASAPGIVVFAKDQGSYGKLVIINHAGGLQTRYAQLETIQVNLGQTIQKDDIIGTVGATGQPTSRETHLHFEIRADEPLGWTAKDPKEYLK
ncbi:M23 family metallopeptidase [Okeanomitos corallinicola TIOX110]|uniref:M23 family metallopeptidase n=1 Tax=Okeanomitos corallinicola TIOX110 TaxID=3133117 RepID=A0ABZ2UX54_9CYAN